MFQDMIFIDFPNFPFVNLYLFHEDLNIHSQLNDYIFTINILVISVTVIIKVPIILYKIDSQQYFNTIKMRIKIAEKSNNKLLNNFPKDPFSDIAIKTKLYTFNLCLAYLSIDSLYFSNITRSNIEVNLSQFQDESVVRILRSLYGDELQATNIDELVSFFEVIQFLDIQEYKNTIVKQILKNQQLFQSIQILEFCFQNNFIKQQITNLHFSHNLRSLTNSKNYLKLNKISSNTINQLLLEYAPKGDHQTINHILQNYFCRNHIQPSHYFQKTELKIIMNVWQKHHHKIQPKQLTRYQSTGNILQIPSVNKLNRKQSYDSQTNASQSSKLFFKIEALKKKVTTQNKQKQIYSVGTRSQYDCGNQNQLGQKIGEFGMNKKQKINPYSFNKLSSSDKTANSNHKSSLSHLPRNSMQ